MLGHKIDVSVKLLHDHLANYQAQADTIGVYLSRVFERAKQRENFLLVFSLDTLPIVNNR